MRAFVDAVDRELGHVGVSPRRCEAAELTEMGAACTQVDCEAIVLDEELDAAPTPVGERVEEVGHVGDPRIGTSGQVCTPNRRSHEGADRFEVVPVARVEVVGVPLAQLPRLHPLILLDMVEPRARLRSQSLRRSQCPSVMTSTSPSTTEIAV